MKESERGDRETKKTKGAPYVMAHPPLIDRLIDNLDLGVPEGLPLLVRMVTALKQRLDWPCVVPRRFFRRRVRI